MKNYTKTEIDRVWFSCLLRHVARKRSGSILTTAEPARGPIFRSHIYILTDGSTTNILASGATAR